MRFWDSLSDSEDAFQVRLGNARGKSSRPLSGKLSKLLSGRRIGAGSRVGVSPHGPMAGGAVWDQRQRVIVKVAFKSHNKASGGVGGGGGIGGGGQSGGLRAHGRYLERDGAGRDNEKGVFFDRDDEALEQVQDRLGLWEDHDPRHFRLVLAPESGARLIGEDSDLKPFTRDVMAGMERDLGQRLEWLAVEHANTDNPHVHVIVRGVREDGRDLVIPRDYMAHGLRERAREVATDRLGLRGLEDERLRRMREIEGRGLNSLDRALEQDMDRNRRIRLQDLGRDHAPGFGDALRARARELETRGLAHEVRRNVLEFTPGWKEKLEQDRPLDVARQLRTARLYEPRLGRVAGQVLELGPRGENPDRALLILDTPEHGRVLVNTSREAIADVQRGSLVALEPAGKRPVIERLAFHSVSEQVRAVADTALDRELDRIAKGHSRELPSLENIERALQERAQVHLENGMGRLDDQGRFSFKDGARQHLHDLEQIQAGRSLAQQSQRNFLDPKGDARDLGGDNWKMRGQLELHSGKTAILERRLEMTIAPLGKNQALEIGKGVSLQLGRSRSLDLSRTLQIGPPGLSRGLELGR